MKKNRLVYDPKEVQQYHGALWVYPPEEGHIRHFVILAGPSGTGKTQLARVYAAAVLKCESLDELKDHPQFKMVAVRPEWTDSRDLLGYYDPISKTYRSTPVLELVLEAVKNPELPYFLILDEMNIAHVEYYFSDFLSAMESGEPISLHSETFMVGEHEVKDGKITLPTNIFVTGTINVDETTHEISPKVLDRAYVLVLKADWDLYYENCPLKDEFPALWDKFFEPDSGLLWKAAKALEPAGLGFGYRTAEDIVRYVARFKGDQTHAIDQMFVSKILPKIRGTESEELKKALEDLIDLSGQNKLDATKGYLEKMKKELEEKGFTKFTPIK